jgi:hypothetical protein
MPNAPKPRQDAAIPIVFPDYRITVETPEFAVTVPDLIPWGNVLPDRLKIPRAKTKVENLGHAGILIIEGSTGRTRYYEYGRYDPAQRGWTRQWAVADVTIGKSGRPTRKSLEKTLSQISVKAGLSGRITGAYIELAPGAFLKMDGYATARIRANADAKREPYSLLGNSCLNFMKEVAEVGGARMPLTVAPHPAGYVVLLQMLQPDLSYDAKSPVAVEDIELE